MSEVEQPRKKKMVKRKPARQQVEIGEIEKKAPEQSGTVLNIWYGKWAGGDKYDSYNAKEHAPRRVSIAKDAGYTRADGGNNPYLCLFFARGQCPYGSECTFLHRLPPPASALPDTSSDVFGREKHSDYRDDMGGVGSFTRQNRTLYIGKLKEGRHTAEVVERHFEEFGEIERIRILQGRGVAFVTYVSELNAQFAKEAMMHQSLDDDEVLNVRWATEDPNPAAKRKELAHLTEQGEAGIAKGLDPEFVQHIREMDELEGLVEPRKYEPGSEDYAGDVREAKRARIEAPEPEAAATEAPATNKKSKKAAAAPAPAPEPEPTPAPVPEPEPVKTGLLSANAMDSLKFLAAMRQQAPQAKVPALSTTAPKAVGGLGGLADYGSDSDEE